MSAARQCRGDEGFTLIELMVASLLFSLVFIVVGSIFLTMFRTNATITDSSSSASQAQIAASSIDAGVRNSSNFSLQTVGADQLLVAHTADTGSTLSWICQAWYYSASEQSLRMTTKTSPIDAPTAAELDAWTLLVDGIQPRSGTTVFIKSGIELVVAFQADVERAQPIAIENTVIPPINDPLESSCF